MEQQEQQVQTVRKLTKELKLYIKKVEEFEGNHAALDVSLHFLDDIRTTFIL